MLASLNWKGPLNGRYCTFVPPPKVRVRATVKLSAAFFHDELSAAKGGGGVRKYNSAVKQPLSRLVNSLFSHDIKYTNSTSSSPILFPIALALFLEFFSQSNPHGEDLRLILRNTKFRNRFCISIYGLLLPSKNIR